MGTARKPELDRRRFLTGSTAVLAAGRGLLGRERVSQERKSGYRIVYNDDSNAPILMSESLEHFLELAIGRFRGTQVDALFWNVVSSDVLHYPSEVAEMVGAHLESFESAGYFQWYQRLMAIIDERPDYLQAMADRARARGLAFFASLRMNDCHESPVWKMADTYSRFRKEHPEFLLGDAVHPGFSTGFDFTHDEVRERRFRIVEELATRYRLDGIELDFLRHPAYFKPDEAYRKRHLITGLVRRVRARLDRHREETGRRVRLAVRVATPMEIALRMGLDVETWIREGLPDLVIAATPRGFELSLPLEQYVEAVRDRSIPLMAQLGWHQPVQEARGAALNFWNQGADGIYLFNWYSRKDRRHESLREIGDPGLLRRRDKVYPVHSQERELWADTHPPAQLPLRLSPAPAGEGVDVRLRIGDDVTADAAGGRLRSAWLRMRFEGIHSEDRVEVALNGTTLDPAAGKLRIDDTHMYVWKYWVDCKLPVPPLQPGINRFRIRLAHRNPHLDGPATLVEVKVELEYGEPGKRKEITGKS